MTKQGVSLRASRRQPLLLMAVLAMLPVTAEGRENRIIAGLAVREGYDSNIYRTDENHVLQWTTTLTPSLNFASQGQTDSLALSYAPGLQVVDHESVEPGVDKPADFGQRSVNHDLTLNAEKTWFKDLQVLLSEEYIKSDDPDLRPRFMWEPDRGVNVAETNGRRRYWTNAASLTMRYSYAQESNLAIAYNNSRLENDDAQLAGSYDRHHPTIISTHRFSEQWRTVAGYAYTRANFQHAETTLDAAATTADLVIHNPTLELDYNPWLHATAFGSYSFEQYQYQNGPREGYHINTGRLGWRQEFAPKSTADLAVGYSHTAWKEGGSEGAISYEGHVATTMGLATVSCGAARGFEGRYFDGTDSGLSKYWRLQAALMYQLTQNLAADLAASYREDNFLEARQDSEEDVIQTTAGFSYKLSRWAILSLHYIFRDFTTTAASSGGRGDYDAHRLFLELSTSRELWRW